MRKLRKIYGTGEAHFGSGDLDIAQQVAPTQRPAVTRARHQIVGQPVLARVHLPIGALFINPRLSNGTSPFTSLGFTS